jgi:hypothetical protein
MTATEDEKASEDEDEEEEDETPSSEMRYSPENSLRWARTCLRRADR